MNVLLPQPCLVFSLDVFGIAPSPPVFLKPGRRGKRGVGFRQGSTALFFSGFAIVTALLAVEIISRRAPTSGATLLLSFRENVSPIFLKEKPLFLPPYAYGGGVILFCIFQVAGYKVLDQRDCTETPVFATYPP